MGCAEVPGPDAGRAEVPGPDAGGAAASVRLGDPRPVAGRRSEDPGPEAGRGEAPGPDVGPWVGGAGWVGSGCPAVGRVVGLGGGVLGAGGTVKSGGGVAEMGDQAGRESSSAADRAEAVRRADAAPCPGPCPGSGSAPTLGLGTQLRGSGLQALPETGAVGREAPPSAVPAGREPKKSEGPVVRGGASGKRADAGGGGGALTGSVGKGVPPSGASGEVPPSCAAAGEYGRTQDAGMRGGRGAVAPVGREGRSRGPEFRAPAPPSPSPPFVPAVPSLPRFSWASYGCPVAFAGFSPGASLRWSPSSPGSGGRGGTSGRGGIEARRASVLMHPPFPLARAVVLVRGPSCACPGGPVRTRWSVQARIPARRKRHPGADRRPEPSLRACASLYGLLPSEREPVRDRRGICPEHPPTLR